MKVLFAIDGSAHAFEAVSQVGQLLTAGRDEVALYCSPPEFRLQASGVSPEMLARARQALADSVFEEARERLPAVLQAGVHTHFRHARSAARHRERPPSNGRRS